ncbi:MAG TPA: hypothetical protein VFF37_06650 [Streptomyces sp.]|nr:hypothetical protein [Streptomyces sp.]
MTSIHARQTDAGVNAVVRIYTGPEPDKRTLTGVLVMRREEAVELVARISAGEPEAGQTLVRLVGGEARAVWAALSASGAGAATPAWMTVRVAAHVLWHYGDRGYPAMEPGGYIGRLIALIASADRVHRSTLGQVYPAYVAAVVIASDRDMGMATLRDVAALVAP